jgi:hypothetical protein
VTYSIDTSALIDGWVRYYPRENFPALWDQVETLIGRGELKASKEVLDELQRQDDDLHEWARAHPELFVEVSDPVQDAVTELMDTYYNPDKPEKGINGADPFVIALAITENPVWTVVSGERPGSAENPKIPYVCARVGVPHLTFLGLIQAQGWRF